MSTQGEDLEQLREREGVIIGTCLHHIMHSDQTMHVQMCRAQENKLAAQQYVYVHA